VRKSTMLSPSNSEFACMMLNTLPQPTIFGWASTYHCRCMWCRSHKVAIIWCIWRIRYT
jgi:hypothetical protein